MRAAPAHRLRPGRRALRVSYVGSWAGRSTRRPSSGAACGNLFEAGGRSASVACGGGAYDSLRLEKGYRLWGQDIDEEHDPYEAGSAGPCAWARAAIHRPRGRRAAKERGVTRRLCCLVTDDSAVVLRGQGAAARRRRALGYVTSAGFGATLQESIAYGYLPVGAAELGTRARRAQRRRRHR